MLNSQIFSEADLGLLQHPTHHLFRIYFKLCPNDSYFDSGEKKKILNLCQEIIQEDVLTISFSSKLIGNLVAAFPTITLGPFYYRALEMDKAKVIQRSNGNYDALVSLFKEAKKELCWWITNIVSSLQHFHVSDPDITIYTD